jgi:thiamine biosynthesis lipoprotein
MTTTATFPALGTTATLLVDDPGALSAARLALDDELRAIDEACSRFRDDSELMRVNAAAGATVRISKPCAEAIEVALRAAVVTDGLVDPTIGTALRLLGYDRDFELVAPSGPPLRVHGVRVPGWQKIELDVDAGTVRVPSGVELDLGATAKALCADRAARRAHDETGAGVLIGLGGDIAVAGPAPDGGWPVRVTDDHTATTGGQVIALYSGGLATSGTIRRNWLRGNRRLHHLVDPSTGEPADGEWRTVSVAAASCVDANIASTASVVMSSGAVAWLADRGLPARLVAPDGRVTTVGAWPAVEEPAC